MALFDDAPILIPLLRAINGVKTVTEGWPNNKTSLPCITLMQASNVPNGHTDDRVYTTEVQYYLHIFAVKRDEVRKIADGIDATMEGQGYTLKNAYDLQEPDNIHYVLIHGKTVGKD